jgi:murein DD-endopeptidase MepM/ murein hydrolase activator NlpD
MSTRLSRRSAVAGGVLASLIGRGRSGQAQVRSAFSLPIGIPGRVLGDGFIIRHGYACENTWFAPGWWHTGENWYLLDGSNTAGASVYAVADGEVVFGGYDYPGRVVIIRHADDLYSMYGHLDYALPVTSGPVARGDLIGTVLDRTDGAAPSHLHFEIRTFLTRSDINGDAPRYGVHCGYQCPPGPGYWPMIAPEHPSEMGWRNPMHEIIPRATLSDGGPLSVVLADGAPEQMTLWTLPSGRNGAEEVGTVDMQPGDRLPMVDTATGPADSAKTSAEGYRVWYRTRVPGLGLGWLQGVVPDAGETGSDGRPSSVRLLLLPDVTAH